MEPAFISSAEGLKQSALTNLPRIYFSIRIEGKYIDRQSIYATIVLEIMNDL